MKKNPPASRRPASRASGSARGFSLIITISMMVLLSLLAVGLLGLSTISLRASSQGEAMQVARANARLALMLAVGDLQKKLGPDQRISAPAAIAVQDAPLGVTGAWQSWKADELTAANPDKDAKFLGWLTSEGMRGEDSPSKSPVVPANTGGAALLLGEASLGDRRTQMGDEQELAVPKLEIESDRVPGRLAWVTLDESVKSRLDLADPEPMPQPAESIARAGSPARDGVFALNRLEQVKFDREQAARLASYDTTLLAADTKDLAAYRPDLTLHALSLMTDTVDGGLKGDLSLRFSGNLPADEAKQGLYESHGLTTGDSDPPLSLLAGYHNLPELIGKTANRVAPGPGAIAASVPPRYSPTRFDRRTRTYVPNRVPPPEPVLIPSLLRVDLIFSLVTRDVHGGRANGLRSSGFPYLLHLMYLPVVTLHNPYDTPLVFDSFKLTFKDLPIGFQYLVDNQPLTTGMVPLQNHFVAFESADNSKEFGITLKADNGTTSRGPMRLEPGQTKLFGTPRVPPTWTWAQEQPGAGADGINLFDWRSDKTSNFNLAPTLITQSTTTACGFDVDWLQPRGMQTAAGRARANGEGIVALRGTEQLGVRFGPVRQPSSSFSVAMDLVVNGRETSCGAFNVNYGDINRLTEILQDGSSLRFPDRRVFPATFPERAVDGVIRVRDIYEPNNRPVRDYVAAKPFAIFSLSGRTTVESFVPARPYADASPVINLTDIDLSSGKEEPGDQPLELVMMPIRNNTAAIEENRAKEEGYFFGGHGTLNGTPRATFYELPRIPLQSLAQFRHANLASSGLHPFTTYTVGESRAHPMIPSDSVESRNSADGTTLLDHTWLANAALWDSSFLSTLASYESEAFGAGGRDRDEVMEDFFRDDSKLLNPRFVPLSSAANADQTIARLKQDDGWRTVAAFLALKGGFNVNSTSVDAWVAVLSALRDTRIVTDEGFKDTGDFAALPRVRRPAADSIDRQPIALRQNRWQGYRELSEEQVRRLAEEIVDEVRSRGPFLSLSEFVNRRLGPASDDRSQRGAIEAAIARSEVNLLMETDGLQLDAGNLGTHDYANPEAAYGPNTVGAPGSLSQGDVLSAVGSRITVRGDTFVVRAYGEATDSTGRVLAKSWCEAVVQRMPDYLDAEDAAETPIGSLRPTNRTFGRRFDITSFRWLSPEEI